MAFKLLIDGRLVPGATVTDVIDPATGQPFESCPCADSAQLEAAIAAGARAFAEWRQRSFAERGAVLMQLADAIEARIEDFARLLTREQGKPLNEARGEIAASVGTLRGFSKARVDPETLREDNARIVERHWTPLGVVAAITPWNAPIILLVVKLAPALMTGNVVIAKPAPTTPLTTLLLGEVAAGIVPAGVLQVLAGGNEIGAALTSHPRVAKISFTGSTATGRKVMESGASGLKRLTLELGGNDAAIVLEDADIAAVAPKIFRAATFNAGQICFAAKRIYAPAGKKYDELCAALVRCANEAIVDNGDKQDTQIGPIQNRPQYEKVLGYLKDAHAKGKVIAGGKPLDREGYFIAPTVVRDIADDSALVREEQFGPIIPVLAYSGLDDVVARANATDYGLGATIWTSNPRAAMELARRLDTGTVWINDFMSMNPGVPMSPARQSGIGVENGMEGLREYMQAHIVSATL